MSDGRQLPEGFDYRPARPVTLTRDDGVSCEISRGEGKQVVIRHFQDVEPVLERNKKLVTATDGYSESREVKHLASIPLALALQWEAEGRVNILGETDFKELTKLMNDADYRHLRTSGGKA